MSLPLLLLETMRPRQRWLFVPPMLASSVVPVPLHRSASVCSKELGCTCGRSCQSVSDSYLYNERCIRGFVPSLCHTASAAACKVAPESKPTSFVPCWAHAMLIQLWGSCELCFVWQTGYLWDGPNHHLSYLIGKLSLLASARISCLVAA